jgi:hypothetical protein
MLESIDSIYSKEFLDSSTVKQILGIQRVTYRFYSNGNALPVSSDLASARSKSSA